jgi:hypothetical protein
MAQIWVGMFAPGDPFFMFEDPRPRSREVKWEREVRRALRECIIREAAMRSTLDRASAR